MKISMTTFLLGGLLIGAGYKIVNGNPSAPKTTLVTFSDSPIQIYDAYFQVDGNQPHHLMDLKEAVRVRADDKYSLWMNAAVPKDAKSPCSRRAEKSCTLSMGISGKDEKMKVIWRGWSLDSFDFSDGSEVNFVVPGAVSKDLAPGQADLLVKLTAGTQEIVLLSVPIKIE